MKTSKAPKKQSAAPLAAQYDNTWLEAAAEAGSEFGKILKFVKGEWQIGDDSVPEGTQYIAFIDEVARGWIKFENQSVTERHIVKVRDGKPPPREELGNTDKSQWEIGDDGKPCCNGCCRWHQWTLRVVPSAFFAKCIDGHSATACCQSWR